MGRKPIEDGLHVFRDWLLEEKFLRPATARSYTSCARRAVKALGGNITDEQAVSDYFDNRYREAPFSYGNAKRSWILFGEWIEEKKGTKLPPPGGELSQVRSTLPPLPDMVRVALADLMESKILPLSAIEGLIWDDVEDRGNSGTYVSDPSRPGRIWVVEKELLEPLRAFAKDPEKELDLSQPLVPTRPGGMKAYSYRGLRREVTIERNRRKERNKRVARHRRHGDNQPALLVDPADLPPPLEPPALINGPLPPEPGEDLLVDPNDVSTEVAPPAVPASAEPAWWTALKEGDDS